MTNIVKLINILTLDILIKMTDKKEDYVTDAVKGTGNLTKNALVGTHNLLEFLHEGLGKVAGLVALTGLAAWGSHKLYNDLEGNVNSDTNTRLYAPIIRTIEEEPQENGFPYGTLVALTGTAALLGAGTVLGVQKYRNRPKEAKLEDMPELRASLQENYRS